MAEKTGVRYKIRGSQVRPTEVEQVGRQSSIDIDNLTASTEYEVTAYYDGGDGNEITSQPDYFRSKWSAAVSNHTESTTRNGVPSFFAQFTTSDSVSGVKVTFQDIQQTMTYSGGGWFYRYDNVEVNAGENYTYKLTATSTEGDVTEFTQYYRPPVCSLTVSAPTGSMVSWFDYDFTATMSAVTSSQTYNIKSTEISATNTAGYSTVSAVMSYTANSNILAARITFPASGITYSVKATVNHYGKHSHQSATTQVTIPMALMDLADIGSDYIEVKVTSAPDRQQYNLVATAYDPDNNKVDVQTFDSGDVVKLGNLQPETLYSIVVTDDRDVQLVADKYETSAAV